MIQNLKSSILCLRDSGGIGTGFVVSEQGHIMTCNHVVSGERVEVISHRGDRWSVPVLGRNPSTDLALLQVEKIDAQPLFLADPTSLTEGQTVFALGHPLGLNFTVSKGIISSCHRIRNGISYVQTDVSLNPGNSGGPIVNERGEAIGIADKCLADSQGLSFAVALRHILAFAAQLRVKVKCASDFPFKP